MGPTADRPCSGNGRRARRLATSSQRREAGPTFPVEQADQVRAVVNLRRPSLERSRWPPTIMIAAESKVIEMDGRYFENWHFSDMTRCSNESLCDQSGPFATGEYQARHSNFVLALEFRSRKNRCELC